MFGDLKGMMGKLKEARQKAEETKKRLDGVLLQEEGAEGKLKVEVTANREIREIQIDNELLGDKEALEDYLLLTLNRALKKAEEVHNTEMAAVAREGMPNIPGMDQFMK